MSNINLKNILYDTVVNENGVVPSLILLFAGYWIQDVVFPEISLK